MSRLRSQKFLRGAPKAVCDRRLFDAFDVILTLQNSDGGFASYELVRGPTAFLEKSTLRKYLVRVAFPPNGTRASP